MFPDEVLEIILSFLPGYLRIDISNRLGNRYRLKLFREYYNFGYIPYRGIPIVLTEAFTEKSSHRFEDRIVYVPCTLWKPIHVIRIQRYLSFFSRPYMPRFVGMYRLSREEYYNARAQPKLCPIAGNGFHLKFDVCKYPCEYICDFLMNWKV